MTGRPQRDWQRELRHTWPLLRPDSEGQLAVYPLQVERETGAVLVATDSRRDHHLLVPVHAREEEVDDLRSAHIRMTRRNLVIDGRQKSYLDLVCHRPDLNTLFDDVLAAILDALATSHDRASTICGRVLNEWRELLRARSHPLAEQAVRGLIGELVVLEQVLIGDAGIAVQSTWTGPDRAPHDFHLGGHDLEVKSVGTNSGTVQIHGLDQLDAAGRRLHLVLVRLRQHPDGATLPELVERVRSRCRDTGGLNEQLSKASYSETDAGSYEVTRYRVEQIISLEVDDVFPRLTRRSLACPPPEELTDLCYTLDLVALLPRAQTGTALTPLFARSSLP